MSFSFTSFYGNNCIIENFNDLVSDYNHYIILYFSSSNYNIICFDNSISVEKSRDGSFRLTCDSYANFKYLKFNGSGYNVSYTTGLSFSRTGVLAYSCEDLLMYKDTFVQEEFDFVVPLISENLSTFVLQPIAEEQQDNFINVFHNVFNILPILLVLFVGFIGIRKAISWLSSLLRRS